LVVGLFTAFLWFSTRALYVFTDTVVIGHIVDGGGVPEARIFIKNFGQTPAYDVMGMQGFAISTFPPPKDLNLTVKDSDFSEAKTKTVMGPGQSELVIASPKPKLNRAFTEEERNELGKGLITIYVYGKIRYRDTFGSMQWTSYRFMVGGPVRVRGGHMVGCEEGNDAT
jgi:hypothetical protein